MENATQALFMAAGVLIAVMIISLGVYLFSSASNISETYDMTMSATEIQKFNSQFSKFNKTHSITQNGVWYNYNTVSDVISAINLSYSINSKNNYDIQSSIQVSIELDTGKTKGITPLIQKAFYEQYIKKLNNDPNAVPGDRNQIYKIYDVSNKEKNKPKSGDTPAEDLEDTNVLLKKFSESKLVDGERVYKYVFDGEIIYNNETGLVDIINFKKVENINY